GALTGQETGHPEREDEEGADRDDGRHGDPDDEAGVRLLGRLAVSALAGLPVRAGLAVTACLWKSALLGLTLLREAAGLGIPALLRIAAMLGIPALLGIPAGRGISAWLLAVRAGLSWLRRIGHVGLPDVRRDRLCRTVGRSRHVVRFPFPWVQRSAHVRSPCVRPRLRGDTAR